MITFDRNAHAPAARDQLQPAGHLAQPVELLPVDVIVREQDRRAVERQIGPAGPDPALAAQQPRRALVDRVDTGAPARPRRGAALGPAPRAADRAGDRSSSADSPDFSAQALDDVGAEEQVGDPVRRAPRPAATPALAIGQRFLADPHRTALRHGQLVAAVLLEPIGQPEDALHIPAQIAEGDLDRSSAKRNGWPSPRSRRPADRRSARGVTIAPSAPPGRTCFKCDHAPRFDPDRPHDSENNNS